MMNIYQRVVKGEHGVMNEKFFKEIRAGNDDQMMKAFGDYFETISCSNVSDRYLCVGMKLPGTVIPGTTLSTIYFSRNTEGKWMFSEQ